MKYHYLKLTLCVAFIASIMAPLDVMAKPVGKSTAIQVAQNFATMTGMDGNVVNITEQTPFTQFYIFSVGYQGFVIVSADDCVKPILGHSNTSAFSTERIPENVLAQLSLYEREIAWCKEHCNSKQHPDWQMLMSGMLPRETTNSSVSPLIATQWGQSPYYNNKCPYNSAQSARTVTGCVATATAQIMKKWNHPATGWGSHSYATDDYGTLSVNFGSTSYLWSSMPASLSSSSSSAQVNAVSTLMYHVGVAVEMHYGTGSSGASNENQHGTIDASSETALQRHFKYRSDMAALCRDDYSDGEWSALLMADLNAGRPILFSGSGSSGGHSFVCDGYNTSGEFHINWGWEGMYDGYYVMGALNTGGGGTGTNADNTFNSGNVAITHIQPNTSWSSTGTTNVTATVQGGTGCSVTGTGSYAFGDTVELKAVAAQGYSFTGWSDGYKFNPRQCIANGGSLSFTAKFAALGGDTITYCPGNRHESDLGSGGTTYWGIRIPASALTSADSLTSVQLYVNALGTYTMTIYSGTSAPTTTLFERSYAMNRSGWITINLTPVVNVQPGVDLWVTFYSGASMPAAATYYSGNSYGLLWGSNFTSIANSHDKTWMIKAIFNQDPSLEPQPPQPGEVVCFMESFPYTVDFEESSDCLMIEDNDEDGSSWEYIDGFGYNGSRGAYISNYFSDEADDNLVLPGIAIAGGYNVSWKVRAYRSAAPQTYEVLAGDSVIFSETLTSTTFVNRSATFNVSFGDTLCLKFHYINENNYYYLFLDDITVEQTIVPVQQYTVTVTANNTDWGAVTGGGVFDELDSTTLVATAAQHCHFLRWSDNNTDNPRQLIVNGNITLTAIFALDTHVVTAVADDVSRGVVYGAGAYAYGGTATLRAVANENYLFIGWSNGEDANPYTLTVVGDTSLTALFESRYITVYVHDTTYISVHDTTIVTVYDTTFVDVPYAVHDTTYITLTDTVTNTVYDTTYVDVPYSIHDTTYITLTDTVTNTVYDTTYVDVPYSIHDTTYITLTDTVTNTVYDTTFIDVPYPIHDTTYIMLTDTVTNTVYDTTFIDVPYPIHDTTYITLTDTVTNTVYDTTYVNVPYPVHDTTYITLTDTVTNTVYDTTYVNVPYPVHDTTYITLTDTVTNTVYDTIDNYVYDTTFVTDTLWLTVHDTLWLHDTIVIHDTVYVPQEGIGNVDAAMARIFASDGQVVVESSDGGTLPDVRLYDAVGRAVGRSSASTGGRCTFDVPASGVYLVRIEGFPARRVVVIR